MDDVAPGSLVIIHCANPKEKFWGVLVRLDAIGVIVRGMDLDSVEDWLVQERTEVDGLIRPSTFFVPIHRVVRIDFEEEGGAVPSYGERYGDACGRDVHEALIGADDAPGRSRG